MSSEIERTAREIEQACEMRARRRKAFLEVYEALAITKTRAIVTKNVEIRGLRKELEKCRLTMKGMVEIYGEDIMERAIERLRGQGIDTHEMPSTILETLAWIGKEAEQKQREEYKRLIEENNNH